MSMTNSFKKRGTLKSLCSTKKILFFVKFEIYVLPFCTVLADNNDLDFFRLTVLPAMLQKQNNVQWF